ncbi:GAP family protein [Synechococcus sp. CCY 9618]|uniref:GAP family protein n=1 Tax=Synechococcus sp. CCY 9618 TaxID=2815602 RepID=UPI001C24FB15|nr:GAP family protein [Synechococcus sp. CCY 9618]
MSTPSLWRELFGFGLAISFSPLHIGLLLLLLVGPHPLRRGSWFVLAWLLTSAAAMGLLLSVGHGLLLTMEKGTDQRTGLDLLAAGGLLALGLNELLGNRQGSGPPGWTRRLDGFCALPLPLLLGLSTAVQVASPDDLFLYAKTAASLLEAGLNRPLEVASAGVFCLLTGTLLVLPLTALAVVGQERLLPLLQGSKAWLFDRAGIIVATISIGLAGYLGWQGIEGLQLG